MRQSCVPIGRATRSDSTTCHDATPVPDTNIAYPPRRPSFGGTAATLTAYGREPTSARQMSRPPPMRRAAFERRLSPAWSGRIGALRSSSSQVEAPVASIDKVMRGGLPVGQTVVVPADQRQPGQLGAAAVSAPEDQVMHFAGLQD